MVEFSLSVIHSGTQQQESKHTLKNNNRLREYYVTIKVFHAKLLLKHYGSNVGLHKEMLL